MNRVQTVVLVSLLALMAPMTCHGKKMITLLPKLMNEHERILAAEAKRDEAGHMLRAARGGWYPTLDLSADAGHEWIDKEDDTRTSELRNQQTLRLNQLVSDFGSTRNSIHRAESVFQRSMQELESTRQEVLLKGISAYLGVIKARERLAYARESEENIVKQTGMEETLVERGAGLSSDILHTKSQLARARALRVSVQGEMLVARNRFKAVFNTYPDDQEITGFEKPEDSLAKMPATLEAAVSKALANNPKLLSHSLSVTIAEYEMAQSRTKYFPTINLFAEAARSRDDQGNIGSREEAMVGAEFNYNLLNGGADKAAIQAAVKNHEKSLNVLNDNKRLIEEMARNAWQNYQISKEKHKFLKNQAAITGEFLALARKERKLGSRSLLDVLNGEVEYINAQSQAVAAEIDTMLAAYNLFHAMGNLTMDIL